MSNADPGGAEFPVSERHVTLIKRLAQIAARTQQSKKRHYDAAAFQRKMQMHFSVLLIAFSALTVASLSLLANENARSVLGNPLLSYVDLLSVVFAAITMALSIYLMTFRFEKSSFLHERSAHRYTSLRDRTIQLAYRIRFSEPLPNDAEATVFEAEKECDELNIGAPPIPRRIHNRAYRQERRSANPRYWFKGFVTPGAFAQTWLTELSPQSERESRVADGNGKST